MPKSRGRKPPPKSKTTIKPKEKSSTRWSITKKIVVGFVTGLPTTLGIVAGIVALLPRIDVQTNERFDPLHPSPISFTITNTGPLSLYNVRFFVGLCSLDWGPNPTTTAKIKSEHECNGPSEVRISDPTWFVREFVVGQKFIIRYDDYVPHPSVNGMRVASAEVSAGVKFNPWPIPWPTREKEFRYKTRQEEDGTLFWMPEPLKK